MLKRFALALAGMLALALPALAAGTINLSLSQQFDSRGVPLGGCKLYTYQTATTTPQSLYADVTLTTARSNPVECDSAGRLPALFAADGTIRVRLTDRTGVVVLDADAVPVLGSASGGGGGSSVDATTIYQTGDVKPRYGTGAHTGWVRANGKTIGSASSGATERANADTQSLFEYLWNTDSTLAVSGGRGASANADFTANKTIALPDFRGRTLAGLDDMGATSAARLSAVLSSTTLGAAGGASQATLTTAQLPVITPAGSVSVSTPTGAVQFNAIDVYNQLGLFTKGIVSAAGSASSTFVFANTDAGAASVPVSQSLSGTVNATFTGNAASATFTGTSFGSGAAHNTTPPTAVVTLYLKL